MINRNKRKAFTLVEIMIVVAIIAILAVIAVPQFLRAKISANQASAQETLRAIGSALESYAADNTAYPSDTNSLVNVLPAYLKKNYFSGVHSGYTYAASLNDYDYTITATPESSKTGAKIYTLVTGSVLSSAPYSP